jgi:uncharacterized protein (TIGR03437 family)
MPNKIFAAAVLFLLALSTRAQTLTPNSWAAGASMPTARQGPFTGVIGNNIYVVGGLSNTSILNVNEIYNTTTGTWSTGTPIPTPRYLGASAVVNNILYAIGGANNGALTVVEAYDPSANTWSTKAPVPFPTNGSTAVVENGLIYLVGGFNAASGDLTTVMSYNPATNAWTTEASLKLAKSNSAAALLGSAIVSAGGLTNPSVTTSDTEGYNPATNSWSSLAPIPTARQVGCFGVLGQLLYVAGGTSSGSVESPVNVMEAYSAASNAWTTGLPQMPTAVVAPGSATVGGALYCFGGTNQATVVSNMQIYEPPPSPPAISAAISASGFGGFSSIAPGTWIEIYGSNLAQDTRGWAGSDFTGVNAPTSLDGTKVTIGGQPAFIDYISPVQVNALVPSNVPTGLQQITVTTPQGTSAAYNVTVNPAEPGLLSPSSFTIGGVQYAVALFTDGTYVLPTGAISGVNSRPAKPGDTIVLYGIGFGPVTPAMTAGQIVGQLNSLSMPFQVSIGGVPATPIYDGLALNFAGLYQFNLTVPNLSAGNAALTLTLGGTAGIQTLYIAIGN